MISLVFECFSILPSYMACCVLLPLPVDLPVDRLLFFLTQLGQTPVDVGFSLPPLIVIAQVWLVRLGSL